MPRASSLIKVLALSASVVSSVPARAADDVARAMSLDPVELYESDEVLVRLAGCKNHEQSELIRRTDAAIKKALAAARPATALLLKRDQVWFRELIANAS